jgi:hypothetical protein
MIYFTKYSEQKFDILNKHKVFFTREMVEGTVNAPEKAERKGKLHFVQSDGVKVVYRKEGEVIKIITFFPVKN